VRVLVTGATGFLGPYVSRALVSRGHAVTGAAVGPAGADRFDFVCLDVVDRQATERAIAEISPAVVVHLAGLAHVGESWRRMAEYFAVNVLGTENVVRAAVAVGARVVLASSAEVYGPVPEAEQPIREDRSVAPTTPYALTKACAERFVLAAGGVVVRAFNVVGPGQSEIFALPAFAAQLARVARGEAEPVLRVGNLEARRDFVHPEDAAAGFVAAAEHGEPGGTYNLASGQSCSIGEALERLIATSGLEVRIESDPERMRPSDIPLLRGASERLRALGWRPAHTLDDAIADLWRQAGGTAT
jgi:GDP-4-dehydro-6-deoxy-D-mannose reductase